MTPDRPSTEEARGLYEQALEVESPEQLDALWERLAPFAPYERPVGDRWGNRGLFTAAGGNFDHKLTELVTNMVDSLLLRRAVELHGEIALDPDKSTTLFRTPAEASDGLYGPGELSDGIVRAHVELRSAGPDRRRERTIVFRDHGVGMEPSDIAGSLLRVGSSRKDGVLWLMGAFGRGGLTVLPNAHGWVVLSRSSLEPEGGVVLTVVRWQKVGNRQTQTALYRVAAPWNRDGDHADPLVLPVAGCPTFESGTRIAVIGFRAEGIGVSRLGDERSLDTVIDTRLFEPPMPVHMSAPVLGKRRARLTQLRGLGRRLEHNPRTDRVEGSEQLPFGYEGSTYQLPVRFYLFSSGGDAGTRRRFVARGHAVLLNSNGQVHAHWTPAEFRHRTRLNKLYGRVLVVVDTDPLPLELRTSLFTADRTELLRNPHTVRLEEELVAFLNDWDELQEANNEMIRESIRRSNRERTTAALSERIARSAQARAWRASALRVGQRPGRKVEAPKDLLDEPTTITGPKSTVRMIRGRTRGVHYAINARDGFIPRQADCEVTTDHLDIDPAEDITVGELRKGRMRVSIAVPMDADLTTAKITVRVPRWPSVHGGLGIGLQTTTEIQVVDETDTPTPPTPSPNKRKKVRGPALVDTTWTTHEEEETWDANTPGEIEVVDASVLAALGGERQRFDGIDGDVRHIKLNEEYAPLKAYTSEGAKSVGDEGVARRKERYALGLGVYLLITHRQLDQQRKSGEPIDDTAVADNCRAAAQGVLAVLPDFDLLASEAGLDGI